MEPTTYSLQNSSWAYCPLAGTVHAVQKLRHGDYKTTNLALHAIHHWKVTRWTYYTFVAIPLVGTGTAFLVQFVAHRALLWLYLRSLPNGQERYFDFYYMYSGAFEEGVSFAEFKEIYQRIRSDCFLPEKLPWRCGAVLVAMHRRGWPAPSFPELLRIANQTDIADIAPKGVRFRPEFLIKPLSEKRRMIEQTKSFCQGGRDFEKLMVWLGRAPAAFHLLKGEGIAHLSAEEIGEIVQVDPMKLAVLYGIGLIPPEDRASYVGMYRTNPVDRDLIKMISTKKQGRFPLELLGLARGMRPNNIDILLSLNPLVLPSLVGSTILVLLIRQLHEVPCTIQPDYLVLLRKDPVEARYFRNLLRGVADPLLQPLFRALQKVEDRDTHRNVIAFCQSLPNPDPTSLEAFIPIFVEERLDPEATARIWSLIERVKNTNRLAWVAKCSADKESVEKVDALDEDDYPMFLSLVPYLKPNEVLTLPLKKLPLALFEQIRSLPPERRMEYIQALPQSAKNRSLLLSLCTSLFLRSPTPASLFSSLTEFTDRELALVRFFTPLLDDTSLPRLHELRGRLHESLGTFGKALEAYEKKERFDRLLEFAILLRKIRFQPEDAPCIPLVQGLPIDQFSSLYAVYKVVQKEYQSRFITSFSTVENKKETLARMEATRNSPFGCLGITGPTRTGEAPKVASDYLPGAMKEKFSKGLDSYNPLFGAKFASSYLQDQTLIPSRTRMDEISTYLRRKSIDPWSELANQLIFAVQGTEITDFEKVVLLIQASRTCLSVYDLLPVGYKKAFVERNDLEAICKRWQHARPHEVRQWIDSTAETERYFLFLRTSQILHLSPEVVHWAFGLENPPQWLHLLAISPCDAKRTIEEINLLREHYPNLFFSLPSLSYTPLKDFHPKVVWRTLNVSHYATETAQYVSEVWSEGHSYRGGLLPPLVLTSVNLDGHVHKPIPALALEENLPYPMQTLLDWHHALPPGTLEALDHSSQRLSECHEGLVKLLDYLRNRRPYTGTPPAANPALLERFYARLEMTLKNCIHQCLQAADPTVAKAQLLYCLGRAGLHCGARWMGESTLKFRQFKRENGQGSKTIEEELLVVLGNYRSGSFETLYQRMIEAYSYSQGQSSHLYSALAQKYGEEFGIPGLDGVVEYLGRGNNFPEFDQAFRELYERDNLISAVRNHLESSAISLLNKASFTSWMVKEMPEGWTTPSVEELPENFAEVARRKIQEYQEKVKNWPEEKKRLEDQLGVCKAAFENSGKKMEGPVWVAFDEARTALREKQQALHTLKLPLSTLFGEYELKPVFDEKELPNRLAEAPALMRKRREDAWVAEVVYNNQGIISHQAIAHFLKKMGVFK